MPIMAAMGKGVDADALDPVVVFDVELVVLVDVELVVLVDVELVVFVELVVLVVFDVSESDAASQ